MGHVRWHGCVDGDGLAEGAVMRVVSDWRGSSGTERREIVFSVEFARAAGNMRGLTSGPLKRGIGDVASGPGGRRLRKPLLLLALIVMLVAGPFLGVAGTALGAQYRYVNFTNNTGNPIELPS
jgi:hypothetical protein